jgi:hypothetical protein
MNRLVIMAGFLRDLAGAGRHTRDRRPAPPSMPHHPSPRFPGSGAVQPRIGIRPVQHMTKVDRSPRILRGMPTAVSCGILLAARAEEVELGIGAALSESTISGFIDTRIGLKAVPEPSTEVLVAVGAVVVGIFALRSRRR